MHETYLISHRNEAKSTVVFEILLPAVNTLHRLLAMGSLELV